jgi:hypothetical protein
MIASLAGLEPLNPFLFAFCVVGVILLYNNTRNALHRGYVRVSVVVSAETYTREKNPKMYFFYVIGYACLMLFWTFGLLCSLASSVARHLLR